MSLFNWLKRLVQAPTPAPVPAPASTPPVETAPAATDSGWHTGCEGDTLWVLSPEGKRHALPLSHLHAVAIETSDNGALGNAFWWLFYGPDEDVAFTLPGGANGEGGMAERLAALPDFHHDMYAAAIRSTEADTFVIWQRPFD